MAVDIEVLRTVRFLASLNDRELRRLGNSMTVREARAAEDIITQGKGGIAFFILLEGEATVIVDGEERATLVPGEHFGELALVKPDLARTATVRAKSDVRVGAMAAWNFRAFVTVHPEVAWPLLETLVERVASRPGS